MNVFDPTKWRLALDPDDPRGEDGLWWMVEGEGDEEVVIAEILEWSNSATLKKETAEFILRACKRFPALVAASERLEKALRDQMVSDAAFEHASREWKEMRRAYDQLCDAMKAAGCEGVGKQ